MDNQYLRPQVRLSRINGNRFFRWDNDNRFTEVSRLLMTTSKDLIILDEDIASGPMVQLLGYRQQDERKYFRHEDTGQKNARTLLPEIHEDSDQKDGVTSIPETYREEDNGQKSREGVPI
jgi:hypothetical protein